MVVVWLLRLFRLDSPLLQMLNGKNQMLQRGRVLAKPAKSARC
jgi:hypothetical protein